MAFYLIHPSTQEDRPSVLSELAAITSFVSSAVESADLAESVDARAGAMLILGAVAACLSELSDVLMHEQAAAADDARRAHLHGDIHPEIPSDPAKRRDLLNRLLVMEAARMQLGEEPAGAGDATAAPAERPVPKAPDLTEPAPPAKRQKRAG